MAIADLVKRNVSTTSVTPSQRVTGTSLGPKPAVKVPSDVLQEYGSQRGTSLPDVVPLLANRAIAIRTYNSMVRSDVSVRISLRAGKAPVLGGDYYVDAYDDTEYHQQVAEFTAANLFHASTRPWLLALQDILRMFDYGRSVMEPVFELREWAPSKTTPGANRKKYTMLKKLAYRPETTLEAFQYDNNGGPLSVVQNAIQANNTTIKKELKIEKLVVFTFEGEGNNLDGMSILRTAYEHWYYKQQLYKIDGIQKERHGIGVPDIQLPIGYSETDKKVAHTLGRNLRTNEYAYIVRPPGFNVGFAELSGNLVNALESATHHDLMIMKNVLIQFLNAQSQGGRATSATAADIFLKSMRYIGQMICDVINQYLIPQIVMYNFETDQMPQLKVRNIGEVKDLQMWAAAMGNLVDKNIVTMDDESEAYVRDVIQWPKKLHPRPVSTDGPSNVKQQYLLRDNPDTPQNEDLAGQAAVTKAGQGTGGGGTGATTGNINDGTLSGA